MADYDSAEAGIDVFEIIGGRPVSSDWKSFLTHHNDAKQLFRVDLSVQDPATLNALIAPSTNVIEGGCLRASGCDGA